MKTKSRMSKVEIQLLLFLYEVGMSKSSLARFFDKDHSTIIHHVQKFGVVQNKPLLRSIRAEYRSSPKARARFITTKSRMIEMPKEKTYAEYLADDRERSRLQKLLVLQMITNGEKVEGCRIIDHSFDNNISDDWA